jgi:DNA-binding protein WhiA
MISFSSTTKNELSRIMPEDRCCQLAELSAIIRMSGVVRFRGSEDVSLRMITENAAIARKIFSLLKNLYSLNVDIMIRKNKNLKKNNSYILEVRSDMGAREVLAESGVIVIDQNQMLTIDYGIPEHLVATRCCKRAYLRGAFLGGGSVSDPERAYHLEFVIHSEQHATDLKNMINSFGLGSKIVERKNVYVVYLKEGEQVVDILNIIGAHSALLRFENTRAENGSSGFKSFSTGLPLSSSAFSRPASFGEGM